MVQGLSSEVPVQGPGVRSLVWELDPHATAKSSDATTKDSM